MTDANAEFVYQKPTNLAGPWQRLAAHLVDVVIALILIYGGARVGALLGQWVPILHLAGDCLFLLGVLYYLLGDGLPRGQTVGKRLFGIAVVSDISHLDCTVLQSLVRNVSKALLGVVDWGFIFLGARKRLGDMFASTVVIKV
ncbi:RDD family protein [Pseudomonas putida]